MRSSKRETNYTIQQAVETVYGCVWYDIDRRSTYKAAKETVNKIKELDYNCKIRLIKETRCIIDVDE